MTAAHTNDELQRLDEQFSAELAELANDIYLNGELFARVDAVWQRRESLGLDSESIRPGGGHSSTFCPCRSQTCAS